MSRRIAANAPVRASLGCALLTMAWLWPALASAAQFTLAPTRVQLPPGALAQTLVLGNEAEDEVSFEISYRRWRMDPAGEWLLEPSDDLIVHPQVVTVAGKGQAVIRVGSLRTADPEGERAYRLLIQELPGERSGDGAAITMLTRLSVPVFVSPARPRSELQLRQTTVHADRIELRLGNQGSGYFAPADATIDLLDADGQVLHHETAAVPYVLAGAQTPLARPLPAGLCARVRRIVLAVGEPPQRLEAPLADDARTCAD